MKKGRDYTSFHRFAYIRYLTEWLTEHMTEFWPVINATGNAWLEAEEAEHAGKSFHAYVIEYGLCNTPLLSFGDFLATAYHDPDIAGGLFKYAIEDIEIWAEEHNVPLPENYRGL